ncbi:hypothetical protein FRC08_008220 [Ceratobasidium sp. 394]|nr:hypothetical protein FRC08_008220 [Ceratobasidium sp. 394]
MDGITMGGGVGLAIGAPFRVATETSQFAMPETKIGYCPDVGATYFLPRLDGELGTYLALTANVVKARSILELGLATHYVPQRRLPALVAALSSLGEPSAEAINRTIEEHSAEISPDDPPASYAGERRAVLDACFSHKSVDSIMQALKDVAASTGTQARWAAETLAAMEARSPTSLRVALEAVRRGKHMQLADALQMEMGIAAAFCTGASPDFVTGVNALLVEKSKERPGWSPATLEETRPDVIKKFFDDSAYVASAPRLELNRSASGDRLLRYALPSEGVVQAAIQGSLPGSGSFALTPAELVASFEGKYGQKIGMRQKLEEIIDRRCNRVLVAPNTKCFPPAGVSRSIAGRHVTGVLRSSVLPAALPGCYRRCFWAKAGKRDVSRRFSVLLEKAHTLFIDRPPAGMSILVVGSPPPGKEMQEQDGKTEPAERRRLLTLVHVGFILARTAQRGSGGYGTRRICGRMIAVGIASAAGVGGALCGIEVPARYRRKRASQKSIGGLAQNARVIDR